MFYLVFSNIINITISYWSDMTRFCWILFGEESHNVSDVGLILPYNFGSKIYCKYIYSQKNRAIHWFECKSGHPWWGCIGCTQGNPENILKLYLISILWESKLTNYSIHILKLTLSYKGIGISTSKQILSAMEFSRLACNLIPNNFV